jgi:hypothetical protein
MPSYPTPEPNGFDLIAEAAREFDTSPILTTLVPAQSTAQLAAEVAKYAGSYEKLRVGLSQDNRARNWSNTAERRSPTKWPDPVQTTIRQAARPLFVEAELAQQEQRYADAARIARDIFRWGNATSRDGNLLDYLVGIAMEGVASQALYPTMEHLSVDDCRATLGLLLEFEKAREPLNVAIERDRIWNQNALGWHGHVWQVVEDIAPRREAREAVQTSLRRLQATKRLLIVELGLRIHLLEQGQLPDSLAELVPGLVHEDFPIDPFDPSGKPFRYTRAGDQFLLYSVGADGQDNGGNATKRTDGLYEPGTDLRLDVHLGNTTPPISQKDGTRDNRSATPGSN